MWLIWSVSVSSMGWGTWFLSVFDVFKNSFISNFSLLKKNKTHTMLSLADTMVGMYLLNFFIVHQYVLVSMIIAYELSADVTIMSTV